jgi:hypothetical protein
VEEQGQLQGEKGKREKKRWRLWLLRVHPFERIEIRDLARLILARMTELDKEGEIKHEAWVTAQFEYPLRSLLIKANGNSTSFLITSLVIVGGGFATSGIAVAAGAGKGSVAAWIVFTIGLLVALAGGVAQQFRFGVRANERRTLAVSMREEGWKFVYEVGDYGDGKTALATFQTRVYEFQRRMADVGAIESEESQESASKVRVAQGAKDGSPGDIPTPTPPAR